MVAKTFSARKTKISFQCHKIDYVFNHRQKMCLVLFGLPMTIEEEKMSWPQRQKIIFTDKLISIISINYHVTSIHHNQNSQCLFVTYANRLCLRYSYSSLVHVFLSWHLLQITNTIDLFHFAKLNNFGCWLIVDKGNTVLFHAVFKCQLYIYLKKSRAWKLLLHCFIK